jgi:hypothetical protein
MAWSTPDISTITDALHDLLTTALANAMSSVPPQIPTFNVSVNRGSPETARVTPCQLSLYLLHVARDAHWRNTPLNGPRPQLNAAQPLSLNLYYLLTAWADTFYDQEQQAMTVALQTFHSVPIYRPPLTNDEFTISVEADTIEEMSRLWQAFTVPMRLSCVVKIGVVFVAPLAPLPPVAKPPVTANVAVGPIPASGDSPVLYVAMNLAFAPYPPPTDATLGVVTGGELVAVAGSSVLVRGAGLDQADAGGVFLSTPDGLTEWQVTSPPSWRRTLNDPADPTGAATLELILPAAYSDPATGTPAPPNRTPTPGVYHLAVGRSPGVRSNRVSLTIAARIDGLTGPSGGLYTLTGAGFAPGATSVSVAAIDVTASATITTGSITFAPPAVPPPSGTYAVGVMVNGVPCLPGPLVTL